MRKEPAAPRGKVLRVEVDDAADIRASVTDPARFEAIFERHHRLVWTYLARLGGRELADDLAGEVFLRAFAGRMTFDPERGAVRSWLYGIATNLWRTHARSTSRGRAALERAWVAQGTPPSSEDGVDAAVDAQRSVPHVLRVLRSLSADDQAIVALYAWEGLSYGEIATALGVPVGTVRSRLGRARQRLRLRELTAPSGEVVGDREPTIGATDG